MKKRIIIAEYSQDLLEIERAILSRPSYEIFATMSGREALSIHRENKADLIIVSLDLKDISGDALCFLIRKDRDTRQVSIIITCNKEPVSLARAARCRANASITRPFHSGQLIKQVTALLTIPQRQTYRGVTKISVRGKSSDKAFFCSSRDISATGMLIETENLLLPSDRIACSFFLPGFGRIITDGSIARTDTSFKIPRYGIRFGYLDKSSRGAIDRFVADRSARNP